MEMRRRRCATLTAAAGFTLVETMVAVVLLSFSVGISGLIIGAMQLDAVSARRSNLIIQTASKLEELDALPASAAQLAPGGSIAVALASYADTAGSVERLWLIEDGPLGLKHVTVRATDLPASSGGRAGASITAEGYLR